MRRIFFRGLERLSAILLFVMFLVTTFQVVARVILKMSTVWSEELARFLYVWIVFLGAAIIMKEDEHISIFVLTERLPLTGRRWLYLVTRLIMIPLILLLIFGAFRNMQANWEVYAPTLDWMRIGYIYLVILVSGVIMLWYIGKNLLRGLAEIRSLEKSGRER